MKTNINREICCDECNETIHNHFNCPVCNTVYGNEPTESYEDLDSSVKSIKCGICGSEFTKKEIDNWYQENLEIEICK